MIDERKMNDTIATLEFMVPKMAVLRRKMLNELLVQGFSREEAIDIIKHSAGSSQ
jgi:hypothetical protein